MFKIGTFSRISRVPIQALRHYDKLGLLKPAQVDAFTGYRYYSIGQLCQLNRILALKDLGLSLEQIACLLESDLSISQFEGMLRLRQAQLANQVREVQAQLSRVEARLRQIETEGKMPKYEVVLKNVEPIWVAGRRIIVTENNECPVGLSEAFEETCNHINASGSKQAGPGIAVWYTPVDAKDEEDVEAAYPLESPIQESKHVKVHELPGEQMASVLFKGDFKDFMQGYDAVLQWIDANDYRVTGPFREIYHVFNQKQEESAVEIQFPVEKG